jgi:hypothetical protein
MENYEMAKYRMANNKLAKITERKITDPRQKLQNGEVLNGTTYKTANH